MICTRYNSIQIGCHEIPKQNAQITKDQQEPVFLPTTWPQRTSKNIDHLQAMGTLLELCT